MGGVAALRKRKHDGVNPLMAPTKKSAAPRVALPQPFFAEAREFERQADDV
jgi:hypothetical protein